MIDEQKFHDPAPAFLDQRRIRAHAHAIADVLRARNLRTRDPVDDRHSIDAKLRFAIGSELGHAHLDQTHPAIAGRAEFFVIAVTRNKNAGLRAGLDHPRAFRKLMPHAIDLDVEHWHVDWLIVHQIIPLAPAFSQPGSRVSGTVGISCSSNSREVYSGGNGGGTGLVARAANSSGNFFTKLWVGHAHASPKAQMVRPAILSATVVRVLGSCTTPPPSNMRSVIFFIHNEPSRQGVHWPHDSCA